MRAVSTGTLGHKLLATTVTGVAALATACVTGGGVALATGAPGGFDDVWKCHTPGGGVEEVKMTQDGHDVAVYGPGVTPGKKVTVTFKVSAGCAGLVVAATAYEMPEQKYVDSHAPQQKWFDSAKFVVKNDAAVSGKVEVKVPDCNLQIDVHTGLTREHLTPNDEGGNYGSPPTSLLASSLSKVDKPCGKPTPSPTATPTATPTSPVPTATKTHPATKPPTEHVTTPPTGQVTTPPTTTTPKYEVVQTPPTKVLAAVVTSPSPTATVHAGTESALPRTGSDTQLILLTAGVLLGAGAALMLLGRRRRSARGF